MPPDLTLTVATTLTVLLCTPACRPPPENLEECAARADEPLPRDWGASSDKHLKAKSIRVVTTDGGRLDWGPDGRIAFDRRDSDAGVYEVWVMDPDEPADATCVTCDVELPVGHHGNPTWHPSGEWLMFQAGVKVGNALVTHPGSGVANEIWVIRPDGTDARELFNITDPNSSDGALHPHFNNAGDEISFARYRRIPAIFEIHSLPFDAADPQLAEPAAVLPAGDPQWSDYLYETHGYTPDDRYLVFTGHSDATEANNDILIVEPECRRLVDQVTASVDVWDEHAHFQPGFDRLLWSSQQDTPKPGIGLFSRADWWVRESDGTKHRLTRFNEEDWPLRAATLTQDGSAIQIKSTNLFAADGEFSPDGNTFAGVLLFRDWGLDEWIVLVDLEEVDPE